MANYFEEAVEVTYPSGDGQDDDYWMKHVGIGIGQAATEVVEVESVPRRVLRGDFDGVDTSAHAQGPQRLPTELLGLSFEG